MMHLKSQGRVFFEIDAEGEILDTAEAFGIVSKKGSWYTVEEKQYQGRPKVISAMREDPALLKTLTEKVNLILTGELPEDEIQ